METKATSQRRKGNAKKIPLKAQRAPQGTPTAHVVILARPRSRTALIAVAIFAILAIAFTSLFFGLSQYSSTDFASFQSNFNSAKSVAIYINDTNSSVFPVQVSCATALIEELSGPTLAHRNASTINLFVLYNDSCVYKAGGLGTIITNYTYVSKQECLNYSRSMPSIFIGYSNANSTTITPSRLYFTGDSAFMRQCGIAYQIT